jgi:hypothetical protein
MNIGLPGKITRTLEKHIQLLATSGRINTLRRMITNWTSKKQQTVSLGSSEAEYQALSEWVQEAMFTQSLLKELVKK